MSLGAKAFHAAVFLYYAVVNYNVAAGLMRAHELLGRPKDDPLVNRMISGCPSYFTGWNLAIQEIYFTLCCVEHIAELMPKVYPPGFRDLLQRVRPTVLSVFVVPCACSVVFMFWSAYAISPSLVFGDFLDVINPAWVNHAIHTAVAPLAILELCMRSSSGEIWTGGFARAATMLSSFLVVYLFAVLVAMLFTGSWPYPLLDPMNGYTFFVFTISCHVITWIWLAAGLYIAQKVQDKRRTITVLKSEKAF